MTGAGPHADGLGGVRKGRSGGKKPSPTSPRAGWRGARRRAPKTLNPFALHGCQHLGSSDSNLGWVVAWVRLKAKLLGINLEEGLGSQAFDFLALRQEIPQGRGCRLSAAACTGASLPSRPDCIPSCILLWAAAQDRALGPASSHPGWPSPSTAAGQVRSQGGARRSQRSIFLCLKMAGHCVLGGEVVWRPPCPRLVPRAS